MRDLAARLSRLPGIGAKSAARLSHHILKMPEEEARALAEAIANIKSRIALCEVCFNLTDVQPCAICADPNRDQAIVCVVEQPADVNAFEKTADYKGVYHVLHGALSPLEDIGPESLRIAELIERLRGGQVREAIIATNPNREGEATAHYLAEALRPLGVRVTRIAHGVPAGSELEYADAVTLGFALSGRREL
ncbi:recombination mediator RecR [bacterium]|nr:recombination mediator RecR [bacterium]